MNNIKTRKNELSKLTKEHLIDRLVRSELIADRLYEIGDDSLHDRINQEPYPYQVGCYGYFENEAYSIKCLLDNEWMIETLGEQLLEDPDFLSGIDKKNVELLYNKQLDEYNTGEKNRLFKLKAMNHTVSSIVSLINTEMDVRFQDPYIKSVGSSYIDLLIDENIHPDNNFDTDLIKSSIYTHLKKEYDIVPF